MSTNRANANSAEELWHYAVGSDKRGPVSQAALAKLLAAGEISAETYVWQPGMDNWVHLSEAGPLKELVSGMVDEAPQEAFVEEDTTFMPSSQLQAVHREMSKTSQSGGELSQDTVVESIESLFGSGGLAAAAQSFRADEARVVQATAQTLLAPVEALSAPVAAAAPTAAAPTAAAPAAAPAAAAAPSPAKAVDDIFASASASSSPFGENSSAAGVHARSESSVLFKLDDLGREQTGGGKSGGNDAFVTDSSGLIDIKAVATSSKPTTGDPFSGANLVMPPRTSASPMSVPLVGRRRGAGPWIFASIALIAIVGAVIAVVVLGKDTPAPVPAVVAEANTPATPAPPEAAKPAEAVAAPTEKPAEPVAPAPAAVDAAKAEADAKAAADAAAALAAAEAEKAAAAKADKKPVTTTRKTDTPKTDTPKIEAKIPPAPTPPKPATGANAAKVDNLLAQLDSGTGKTAQEKDKGDGGSLPDKLSAAAVRSGIRGRFEGCAAKAGGSFTVQTSFVISSSGVVQSARITDAGGTSADVQKCVVQQIKDTSFGQFKDSSMTVNLPVRLN